MSAFKTVYILSIGSTLPINSKNLTRLTIVDVVCSIDELVIQILISISSYCGNDRIYQRVY